MVNKIVYIISLSTFVLCAIFIPAANAASKPNYSALCTRAYDCAFFDPNSSSASCSSSGTGFGKGTLPSTVPAPYNDIFTAAANKANIEPALVAGIFYGGEHGGSFPEPPPPYGHGKPWASSSAGAGGPFQFIPSTWDAYGVDGNGDGKKDIQDVADGAFGAANYLAASGAKPPKSDLHKAIFAYNHAEWYVDQVMDAYRKFGGGTETQPSTTAASSDSACDSPSTGEAFVLGDYAWPVDIKKAELNAGYPMPCKTSSCHHDSSPAFDFSTDKAVKGRDANVVGRAVYAITDGKVDNFHIYNSISGCYSINFTSSKDGFKYWYGHLRKVSVKNGATVKAGAKIAEVGERKCTGNGSYPHLHIDRGSPKGAPGGYEDKRDAGFIPVINSLYNELP